MTSRILIVDDAVFNQKILVPWTYEAALSGIGKGKEIHERVAYRRSFDIPEGWKGKRVLLHFGAVDWQTAVWVNGKDAGQHTGGYAPFSFDITDALKDGKNELLIRVWDPTDSGAQPRGKQVSKPGGIWYTPVMLNAHFELM